MKVKPKGSSPRHRKVALRKLLESRDHSALLAWGREEPHTQRTVFSALYDPDELLRWRAIEALGLLAGNGSVDLAFQLHRALGTSYDKDPALVPEGVTMPVLTEDSLCWCGGWMTVIALTGTLRW